MPKSKLLKDLQDSELTSLQAFRRTTEQIQRLAKHEGRITRYTLAEIVDDRYRRTFGEGEK